MKFPCVFSWPFIVANRITFDLFGLCARLGNPDAKSSSAKRRKCWHNSRDFGAPIKVKSHSSFRRSQVATKDSNNQWRFKMGKSEIQRRRRRWQRPTLSMALRVVDLFCEGWKKCTWNRLSSFLCYDIRHWWRRSTMTRYLASKRSVKISNDIVCSMLTFFSSNKCGKCLSITFQKFVIQHTQQTKPQQQCAREQRKKEKIFVSFFNRCDGNRILATFVVWL